VEDTDTQAPVSVCCQRPRRTPTGTHHSLLGGSLGRALEVHTSRWLPWAGAGGSDTPKRLLDILSPVGTCPVPEYRQKPEDKRFTLKRHPGGNQTEQQLGTSPRTPNGPRVVF